MAEVAAAAKRSARSARVEFSRVRSALGCNRRLWVNGETVMRPNPEGGHDRCVDTRWIVGRDGEIIASSTTYGCHATTLGGYQIGGDYPGYFKDAVEKRTRGVALWSQGCGGNVRPWFSGNMTEFGGGTPEAAEQMGAAHAKEALAGKKSAFPVELGRLCVSRRALRLPLRNAPPRKEILDRYKRRSLSQFGESGWRALLKSMRKRRSAPCETQVLSLNADHHLVYWGGEVCSEVGMGLKDLCPGQIVTPHGYANNMAGYIAAEHMAPQGGYEAERSAFFFGYYYPLAPNTQERLWRAALGFINDHREANGKARR